MVLVLQWCWRMVRLWLSTMFHTYLPSKSTATSLLQHLGMWETTRPSVYMLNMSKKWCNWFSSFVFCSNRREDIDGVEFESDSWSEDSSSDNLSRSLSNNSSKSWEDVSEDSCCDQEGSWLRDNKLGYLYLQYTEMASPYSRVPLAEKVFFCQE